MDLSDGSRVGVIGGGPAGTLTSYFLLEMAERVGLNLEVDIYEPKDFSKLGPAGCNMCGGVISESLVQIFATEGINLPSSVVQRGIDSYVLHTSVGTERIRTPLEEMRIACVHRGSGPSGAESRRWQSFDGFLLELACRKGAKHLPKRVDEVLWTHDRPTLRARGDHEQSYDLVIGAAGVNVRTTQLFRILGPGFRNARKTTACAAEILLGSEKVQQRLGNAMHLFLLDIPRLKFAAVIPKADYVTVCVLGHDVDQCLLKRFLMSPEVRECLGDDWSPETLACRCAPRINVGGAKYCYGDRMVLVGDCGVSRLYKDGIGAAYRAAKACAVTAIFHGVAAEDFQKHYWPTCKHLESDNTLGKVLFMGGAAFRKLPFLRRTMLRMVRKEQIAKRLRPVMSMVLWDTFTGSAPYREVVLRALRPDFLLRFFWNLAASIMPPRRKYIE